MGWQKQEMLDSGVVVEYWDLNSCRVDFHQKTITVNYSGYLSQVAKEEGKELILNKSIPYDLENNPKILQIIENLLTVIEPEVKTTLTVDAAPALADA